MDSESQVDAGPRGFLDIFGGASTEDATSESAHVDPTQGEPTAASATAPEVPDQDLSAEEVVAARFAAALDSAGSDLPTPDEDDAGTTPAETTDHPLLANPDGEPSLDALTPEQLRALAEEAIRLRGEVSSSSRQEAARKVQMAEAAAVAQVQSAYERDVLAVSQRHYDAVFQERLTRLVGEVPEHELPTRIAALANQVYQARTAWEAQQLDAYEQHAQQAALAARKSVPEMRQLYAAELVKRAGLPDGAVAEVLKVRNTDEFPARVEELLGIRDALLAERQKNQQQRRVEANQALRDTTPRTTATGRPPGGKVPDYRGTAAEGAAILSHLHNRG